MNLNLNLLMNRNFRLFLLKVAGAVTVPTICHDVLQVLTPLKLTHDYTENGTSYFSTNRAATFYAGKNTTRPISASSRVAVREIEGATVYAVPNTYILPARHFRKNPEIFMS
jgi:hypothetical protein